MRKAHSKIYQTGLSLRNLIWPAGAVLAVYWLFVGYRFFVNAGIEIVPMIYREIDNGYMANDYWLALKADTTHLRYLFVLFVSKIAKSRDVVEPVLFSIYVLGYVFLVLGLLQLASRQLSSRVSITGATISAVLFLYGFSYVNPGAIFLLPNEATPNLLSRVFLVWAVVFALNRRIHLSLGAVFIAGGWHPLEALLGYPVIAAMCLYGLNKPWSRRLIGCIALWGFGLLAIIIPLSLGSAESGFTDSALLKEFIEVRLGHHYLPGGWAISAWVIAGTIVLSGVITLYIQGQRAVLIGCLAGITLFIGYLVAVLMTENTILLMLQGSKLLILPYFLLALSLSTYLWSTAGSLLRERKVSLRQAAVGLLVVFLIAGNGLLEMRTSYPEFKDAIRKRVHFTMTGNYRTYRHYVDQSELELYSWITKNTEPNQVILHPPELVYIRSASERSSVFQHHLVSFDRRGMREWMERRERTSGYCAKSLTKLREVALDYGASWIIIRRTCATPSSQNPHFRNDVWLVFDSLG